MSELHTRCPACGYRFEVASQVGRPDDEPSRPSAGAISICIACAEPAIFEDDFVGLRLRKPTDEERAALEADDLVGELRGAVVAMRVRHPHSWPGQP